VAVAIIRSIVVQHAMSMALHCLELEPLSWGKQVAVKLNDTWSSAEDASARRRLSESCAASCDGFGCQPYWSRDS
jgi:hypothetical protein